MMNGALFFRRHVICCVRGILIAKSCFHEARAALLAAPPRDRCTAFIKFSCIQEIRKAEGHKVTYQAIGLGQYQGSTISFALLASRQCSWVEGVSRSMGANF